MIIPIYSANNETSGRISGKLKVNGTYAQREVWLLNSTTKQPLRYTLSHIVSGNYSFDSLDLNAEFDIIGQDQFDNFQARILRKIKPK